MKKKIVLMATSLVLVAALAVGGTLAYLTANTASIDNTFTVGNITAELTETFNTDGNNDGEPDKWVGKIVPGGEDDKDPTITINQGSEPCYVYVCITNTVKVGENVVATPNISDTNWETIATKNDMTLYRYGSNDVAQVVNAASADQPISVFTKVAYAGSIDKDQIKTLENKKITVQGYAHQSGTDLQTTADNAAKAFFGFTTTT
ncbi:MAG: SipW-dependent-type signal peptide-containing protein [Bacillota bacterium]|nr:SipW-dependent-type signal peptide-containing protein [Bacillota bacterium]